MSDYIVCTRAIRGGSFSSEPGPTRFLKVPETHSPNPSHEINRTTFITDLVGTPKAQKCDDLVVFVHGYNVTQSDLIQSHRKIRNGLAKAGYQAINPENQPIIEAGLKEKLSPEQMIGRAQQQQLGIPMPSIATIYKHVHADRKSGGKLFGHLRHQGRRRKKHGQGKVKRPTIPNRIDISQRPVEVENRERLGDYECDLIVGAGQSGVLLTVNCRTSGKVLIKKLPNKETAGVRDGLIELLFPYKNHLHTITSDNGKEFSLHEKVAERLSCKYYFARPYHSCDRGSNESLNGLIRQYFPKKMEFWAITPKQVKEVAEALNNRPRKRYKFLTPNEIYEQKLQK